ESINRGGSSSSLTGIPLVKPAKHKLIPAKVVVLENNLRFIIVFDYSMLKVSYGIYSFRA
ncbi:MAG: hypothetical protein DRI73_05345, partial [Bacteroidetes bacterium]